MSKSVVAVDTTVFYASLARIIDGESRPLLGGVETDPTEGRHTVAAEMRKHRSFAATIVDRIVNSSRGAPELVVLRKPEVGNVRDDPSGVRRLGVHWEIVRQLDDAGVPIAEVPLYTVVRIVGAPARGDYDKLTARLQELYPEAEHPTVDEKPDRRYRMTTLGLAMAGAIPAGLAVPIEITDEMMVTLRRGADMPYDAAQWGKQVEKLAGTRAAVRLKDKRARAEAWYESQLEAIRTLPIAELEDRFGGKPPRNKTLRAAYMKRMEREGV